MSNQREDPKAVVHPLAGQWIRNCDGARIEVYGGKDGAVFWRGRTADAGRMDCHTFMQEHTSADLESKETPTEEGGEEHK